MCEELLIISLSRTEDITESHEAKIKAGIRNNMSFRINLVYIDYAKMQVVLRRRLEKTQVTSKKGTVY